MSDATLTRKELENAVISCRFDPEPEYRNWMNRVVHHDDAQRAEIARLRAEVEALREDKARLDWLEEKGNGTVIAHDDEEDWIVGGSGWQEIRSLLGDDAEAWSSTIIVLREEFDGFKPTLRGAIDAARGKEREA